MLHTADGGRTWAPQVLEALASIDAVPGRAWALAGAARVLTTTTRGTVGTPSTLSIRASRRVIQQPTLYRLRRTTTFVDQWAGDGVRDGDGTTPPLRAEAETAGTGR